jgi:hypothetical protein
MTPDYGGWLWLVIDVVAVLILAAGLAYAAITYRRRGRQVTDQQRVDALRRGDDLRQKG